MIYLYILGAIMTIALIAGIITKTDPETIAKPLLVIAFLLGLVAMGAPIKELAMSIVFFVVVPMLLTLTIRRVV